MRKRTVTKRRCFCAAKSGRLTLCLLLLAVVLLSLRFGSAAMDWTSFWGGLLRREGFETQSLILYSLRLPRLLQGVLAGVGLSVSGVLLQSVTGNDLASPSIIGVNAGAGFAVILLLSFFPGAAALLPPAAFLGAFLTTLLIMAIAGRADASKATVILAGIAVQEMDSESGDAIITVDYENHPVKGKLTIYKKGEMLTGFKKDFVYKERYLKGASFHVYAAENIYTPDYQKDENGNRQMLYAKDALVTTVTTGEDGKAVADNLPLGSYYVVEKTAPEGFVLICIDKCNI